VRGARCGLFSVAVLLLCFSWIGSAGASALGSSVSRHGSGRTRSHISVRLPESSAIRELPSAALARRSHGYGWPIRPFHAKHRIRAGFGDPRQTAGHLDFHFGIDISAPDGTPVYAVAPGIVYLAPGRVAILTDEHRNGFAYWHINPAVREHSFVDLHSLIGWIKPGAGHVHFAEIEHDRYVNPLRPGALTPAPDLIAPTIDSITVKPIDPDGDSDRAVRGTIQIIVDAQVRPAQRPPSPWQGAVISPTLIRWRLLANRTPVSEWRTAVDFRNYIPLNRDNLYSDIYAPHTRQNRAGKPGVYHYYLARSWNTSAVPTGEYTIEVVARSIGGKRSTATAPLQIVQRLRAVF
jgi:Peptidase family M23